MKHSAPAAALASLCMLAPTAHAAFSQGTTGLAMPDQTITFESVALAVNQPVVNQFAPFGVVFANAFANPEPVIAYPNISGNRISNFQSNVNQSGLFTMSFDRNLSAAAFALVTSPGVSTMQALLNNVPVETGTGSTSGTDSNNIFRFSGIVFNQITISVVSGDRAFLLDGLQTVRAVPEPASWALFSAALAAGGLVAARRSGKQSVAQPSP